MPNEDILFLSIIFGSGVVIVTISLLYSLVKSWINRGAKDGVSQEEYDNLLQDLERFEASVNKRLQNLETIVTDEEYLDEGSNTQIESPKKEQNLSAGKDTNQKKESDPYQSGQESDNTGNKGLDNMLKS